MAEGAVSGLVDLRMAGDVAGLCRATGSDSIEVAAFATCALGHGTGAPGVVETLLARLRQRGERPVGSRWQAARALGRLRADRAVPDLLRLLAADPHDREQLDRPAADSLVDIGGPQVVRGLLDLLEEQTATGKGTFRVVDALARLRAPEAVRPLLAALWHCLPDSAEHVVRALGEIGDPRAGSALLVLAQSPASDTRLRRAALRALHGLPEAAWPPAHPYPAPETLLHAAQRDPDPEAARLATALLSRTADGREHLWHVVREAARAPDAPECPPHAVAAVCAQVAAEPGRFVASAPGAYHALLRHHLGESAAPTVRRAAAGALAAFSGPLAVDDLLAALGDPHVSDTAADLVAGLAHPPLHRLLDLLTTAGQQRGAARALGGIGDAEAAPALLALATDHAAPAAVRASAADALGALGHRQAAAPLAALAADAEQPGTLRARAVRALGLIGAPESLPVVLACARSPHEAVRARAVAALGGFPVPEAARALGEFVTRAPAPEGTGPDIARTAVLALGRIGAPALPVLVALADGADEWGDDLADRLVAALATRPEAEATAALLRLAAAPELKTRYDAALGGPLALSRPAREAASLALVDRGTPEDLTPLTALLAPGAWFGAQEAAVQALLTIGTTEAHDHVLAFCRRATHFDDAHVDALNTIAEARGIRLG
ncbi:HEAT repeat domain-containing protein [Streptomyces sp. MNP-20]|uniref:HEAT repeat domain-containing protein n=1 Tax=Streptomyces sp. MNP-20 TaxID=2721165 RepID=UPI001551D805|nr:HEAT repeat domain-containing protein [Streptomyces sp. MNP-20]